jgi:PAS domain S-box-containing protein
LQPEDLPVQRAARGEVVRDFEERVVFNDGSTVDLFGNAMPLRRRDGTLRGAVAAFVDITERKRIEAELRAINDELESRVKVAVNERARLFAFSDDLFITAEIGGRPIEVSDSWTRLLGWERKQLLEMPVVDLIHPDDRALVARKLEELRTLGVVAPYDNRVLMADGGWRIISWRLSIDHAGERIYGVGRDVTADRAQSKALAEAERRLYEVQKMESIGHLTGGVAHDFNNLLSAILSNLDIARKRVPDMSTARLIDGAIKGAERGAQLTKRLLAFARRQELKAEPVWLPQLVEGMRELLARSLGPSVRIVTQFPVGLPPVMVDANQLELALLNLAVNARDAMPSGGTLSISAMTEAIAVGPTVTGLDPGDYVTLTVSDSGVGMDEATLARATEPFFTTKEVGKGTGLGLSMVHGLAAQTGGGMRIRSQPGQGVNVDLWLPRAPDAAALVAPPQGADAGPGADGGLTILLVDDDAMVSMGTAALLEDLGHAVVEVHSGRAALDALDARADIDLVITDHAMPGMTGAELASIIRDRRPDMPIIMATGYAELPKGVAIDLPRLQKPLRQEELHRMLSSLKLARAPAAT